MKRAVDMLNQEQRKQIDRAVVEAEAKTACEIVPVVATASGRYDRAEDVIGLWLAIITAIAVWLIYPQPADELGSWETTSPYIGLMTMIVGILLAFIIGAVLGNRIRWLRRLFTPRSQMLDEVALRARQVFFDKRIHHTRDATGLLIYVSLFERMAVVLGDQQVVEKLGQPSLDRLCQSLTDRLRQGDMAHAIYSTIADAGDQLAGPLPKKDGDTNELGDILILLD